MMRHALLASALLAAMTLAAAAPTVLYVSPQGKDTWSGALPQANARRSDGPPRHRGRGAGRGAQAAR